MSLSAHQARREHILAVSRDFNTQPRLSEFIILFNFIGLFSNFLTRIDTHIHTQIGEAYWNTSTMEQFASLAIYGRSDILVQQFMVSFKHQDSNRILVYHMLLSDNPQQSIRSMQIHNHGPEKANHNL